LSATQLVESFFRHEYSRVVAMLARRVGMANIALVEDAVQSTMMLALERWKVAGVPDQPTAWMYRVAYNAVIDALRKQARHERILVEEADLEQVASERDSESLQSWEVNDAMLRMLFVCCDDVLPAQSQLIMALKTLCGFDTREIAQRLFISEENVYKRLGRARIVFRAQAEHFDQLGEEQYAARVPAVRNVIYTLFTEGYLSSHAELAIRQELCAEAIRLATMLANHGVGQDPETFALLALFHLHAARMASRQTAEGDLLLLQEQDRSLWDWQMIETGLTWLAKSAEGDTFSRYHAEAGIAAEHCLAPSIEATNWERIAGYYELIERLSKSPIHRLNRAVAVAQWKGPAAGLAVLQDFEIPTWLAGSYMWHAVLADLHRRCGDTRQALIYKELACAAAPSEAVRSLLLRRLQVDS
jgi:RNA polymerase sigma-70 factor (ECF subfamily)